MSQYKIKAFLSYKKTQVISQIEVKLNIIHIMLCEV